MNKTVTRVSASILAFLAVVSFAGCSQPDVEPSASASPSMTATASHSASPSVSPSPTLDATLSIGSPLEGEILEGEIVATGTACTFEAAVPYRLYLEGVQVRGGMVMASAGCPIGGTWRIKFGTLDAGTYRLKILNISQKDGSVTEEASVNFSVR